MRPVKTPVRLRPRSVGAIIAASSASRASVAPAPVSSVRCQPGGGLLSTRCASRKIPAAEAASEKSSGRTSTPRVTRSATSEGRGLVTRGVRALVDHAFGVWKLHRIEIQAAPENTRSQAVPLRLGFTREGVLRECERSGDRWLDGVIFALLASEWRGGEHVA